jgi:hypothetical protein
LLLFLIQTFKHWQNKGLGAVVISSEFLQYFIYNIAVNFIGMPGENEKLAASHLQTVMRKMSTCNVYQP